MRKQQVSHALKGGGLWKLVGAVTVAAPMAFNPGCSCGPEPTPADAGPSVCFAPSILAPLDGARLTAADDIDPATDGIQVNVQVEVGQSATSVELTVGDETFNGDATDTSLVFERITIPSSEAGVDTALSAVATCGDEKSVADRIVVTGRVDAPDEPFCTIVSPSAGETLTSDADAASDGFQIDVQVRCGGEGIGAADEVRCQAGSAQAVIGNLTNFETPLRITSDGAGAQDITCRLVDDEDASATVSVTVQPPALDECTVTASNLAEGDVLGAADDADGDASNGLQFDLEIASADCMTGTYRVSSEGSSTSDGPHEGTLDAANGATVRANLEEGANVVRVVVEDTMRGGVPLVLNVTADLTAPVGPAGDIELVLADGAAIEGACATAGLADGCVTAASADGSAFVHGLQVRAAAEDGACPFTAPSLSVGGVAVDTTGIAFTAAGDVCTASIPNVTLSALASPNGEQVEVVFGVADVAGNTASRTLNVLLDATAPTCVITAPVAGVLNIASDQDAGTAGLQTNVTVDSDGDSAVVVVGSASPLTESPTGGTATFPLVNVPEGDVTLAATCADAAGNETVATPQALVVDTVAPTLVVTCPSAVATGDDLDAATAGVQVQCSVAYTGLEVGQSVQLFSSLQMGAIGTAIVATAGAGSLDVTATFALQSPSHQVSASAADAAGNLGASDAQNVLADLTPYSVSLTAPATSGPFVVTRSADADEATPGAQVVFAATTNAPDTAIAELCFESGSGVFDCAQVPNVNPVGGVITFAAMTLGDGSSGQVEVRVRTPSPNKSGSTGAMAYSVDLSAPAVTLGSGVACADAAFADRCILAGATTTAPGVFAHDIVINVAEDAGACPFAITSNTVGGVATGTAGAFTGPVGGVCAATIAGVVLDSSSETPDGVVATLAVAVEHTGSSNATTLTRNIGVDVVAPTYAWLTADNSQFGVAADQNVAQPGVQVRLVGLSEHAANGGVTFSSGGATVGECSPGGNVQNCTLEATFADGAHAVTVATEDAAGNTAAGATLNFTVDGSAPGVSGLSLAADSNGNGEVNNAEAGSEGVLTTNVVVTFDAAPNDLSDGRQVRLVSDIQDLGAVPAGTVSGNAVTFAGVSLNEGTHTLSVTGSDQAGNALGSHAFVFVVKTTNPTCVVTAPAAGVLNTSDDVGAAAGLQVNATVSSDAGSGRSVRFMSGGSEVATTTLGGSVAAFDGVSLADGAHVLTAECVDAVGNTVTSAPVAVTVDTSVPTLAFNAPALSVGTALDEDGATPGIQVSYTVDYTDVSGALTVRSVTGPATSATTTVSGDGQATLVLTFTQSGTHVLRAEASDANGNTATSADASVDVATDTWNITLTSPAAAADPLVLNTALDADGATPGAQVTFIGTTNAPDGADVQLLINGSVVETVSVVSGGFAFAQTTIADGTGTYSVNIPSAGTPPKTGTIGVLAYEADTVAPTVAFTTPSVANVALTLNAPAGAGVGPLDNSTSAGYQNTFVLDVTDCAGGDVTVSAGGSTVGTASVSGAGTQSVNVAVSIPDGAGQTISVSCTDTAGNTSAADDFTADVDTVAPSVASLTPTVVSHRRGEVTVAFTAPGDDGASGSATVTLKARRGEALTAANFADADNVSVFAGAVTGGTSQTPQSAFLAFGNTWHFGLVACDDVGNCADANTADADIDPSVGSATLSIKTRTINNAEDDVLSGASVDDLFGRHLAPVTGDLNGDGHDDIVWVAPNEGDSCLNVFGTDFCDGALYVLYGADEADMATQTPVRVSSGIAGGYMGDSSVAVVPSIDGDSCPDVLVSVYTDISLFAVGIQYFPGCQMGAPSNGIATSPAGTISGANFTFGEVICGIGDVTGDGVNDWAAAGDAANEVAVFAGHGGGTLPAASSNAAFTLTNVTRFAEGGCVGLGNVDGVAGDEFAVGAPDIAGKVFVVPGGARSGSVDVTTIPGVAEIAPASPTRLGIALSAGDVDADGDLDLVVGGTGAVAVFKNSSGAFSSTPDITLSSPDLLAVENNSFAVGDTNGDSAADVAVGLNGASGTSGLGLFLLGPSVSGAVSAPSMVVAQPGTAGREVGAIGDVDDDGFADLFFTTRAQNSVTVIYGDGPTP